jgi:hypothetical protein
MGFNQHCLHFSREFDGIGNLAYYFTSLAVCKVPSRFETHLTLFHASTALRLCTHIGVSMQAYDYDDWKSKTACVACR